MSSFFHLVIISSKYILNTVGKKGQPWPTALLILASFESMVFNFINVLFCVFMSTIAFLNVAGIFLDFKYQIKSLFVYYQMLFQNYKQQVFPNYISFVFS